MKFSNLTNVYGKGFTQSNLYQFVQFYKFFPEIFHTVCVKSQILSWSHYRTLLRVTDKEARDWYLQEAINEMWSVRTLDRNIASQILLSFATITKQKDSKRGNESNNYSFSTR